MLSTKKILYKILTKLSQEPLLAKTITRNNVSHASGANYWTVGTFASRTGYTRKVGFFSTNNSNVVIVGCYFDGDNLVLRTHNSSNSTVSVSITCTACYIRDDLILA